VWEVQAQNNASSDNKTVVQDCNPGTNSVVQNLRLTNPAINPAMLQNPTRTSALVLEFPDILGENLHIQEIGLS
jgi:hypothetical protein